MTSDLDAVHGPGEDFTSKDQIRILSTSIKEQNTKIAICFPTDSEEGFKENVATHLRDLLSGDGNTQTIVVEMKGDGWLEDTGGEGVEYYVFIGFPPARSDAAMTHPNEEEFFNPSSNEGHQVSRVVFIDLPSTIPSQSSYIPKNLKAFLHLDGRLEPDQLARRILGHFGGKQQEKSFCLNNYSNDYLGIRT